MENSIVGIIGILALLILLFAGMPVGFVMILVGFLGSWYLSSLTAAVGALGTFPFTVGSNYLYIVIPLFILMGYLADVGGLVRGLFMSAREWVGHLPGGLAIATVATCAGFGAACGVSLATAATMGKVALPYMRKQGYDPKLSTGCVAAAGGLASLIPPSTLMIIYGSITGQSLGKLLIAGFIPGVVSALLLMTVIFFLAVKNPEIAPRAVGTSWKSRVVSLKEVWGILLLAVIIIGGIYTGVFTATEAGATAAGTAFLIAFLTRRLSWRKFGGSLLATVETSCTIFVIIIGASILTQFFALTKVPFALSGILSTSSVHPFVILGGIMLLYIFLGTFLDPVGMMLLTLPIVFPIIKALGFNPIWFGVLMIVLIEIGLVTPPVGMNVYVLGSVVPDVPLADIFRGVFPFFVMQLVTLIILIAFPQISLVLPNMMK